MSLEFVFLIIGLVLAASLLIALGATKIGIPSLVAFLALGMLMGSDGAGDISFNNTELARNIGIIGLVAILFEGGLSTSWRRLRHVAISATLLSTLGIVITAALTGVAAYYLFDLPLLYALIIGAVVSSTDAAAVFATFRTSNIRRRLARVLEAESGLNDPMAIALTIGLISWVLMPGDGLSHTLVLIAEELLLGLAVGVVLGAVATQVFSRLPHSIGSFAPVASVSACAIAFGLAEIVGGSGFLAVYMVGLAIGSTPSRYRSQMASFHEGLAFIAQVVMFVVLGLLVLPHDLLPVAGPSIALALLLMLVIRPIAVWISTLFSNFSFKERIFLGWAGLRGAVPIVLGTFVLSANINNNHVLFNTVFFVVLVSALVQGTTLQWVANKLGVVDLLPPEPALKAHDRIERTEFAVMPRHSIVGAYISELGLPKQAKIKLIIRGSRHFKPTKRTKVQSGDHIFVYLQESMHPELDDVFTRWRRRI